MCPESRIALITLGNDLRGDDGAGILFGNLIEGKTPFMLFNGYEAPENISGPVINSRPETIIIVDTMFFKGNPGDITLVSKDELYSNTVSTHGTLGLYIEYLLHETGADICILGFQPKSLEFGDSISPEVSDSVRRAADCFIHTDSISHTFERLNEICLKEQHMNARKTIMVVDDDRDIVESTAMILESAGFKVTSAESGNQFYESLRSKRPDLIILDVMLETMTEGFNVGDALKSNPEYSSIPIIMISAIDKQTGFPVDVNFIQADVFMEKPLTPDALLRNVKKLINT
ncbi:MAG: hydrogenase maturation protease [Candidatus Latescibacteria bacterium]|nr:hydrogenase maturation protease [Candidatus Latescibacterota bacterium]